MTGLRISDHLTSMIGVCLDRETLRYCWLLYKAHSSFPRNLENDILIQVAMLPDQLTKTIVSDWDSY